MSYLDRIAALHRWEPSRYRPFVVDDVRVGRVTDETAALLAGFPKVFRVGPDAVALADGLGDVDARSRAVHETMETLAARGDVRRLRGETYGVSEDWTAPVRMTLDRGMVPIFGVKSYGVHVNGFVRDADGLHMWIATRARDKRVAPGKLDHMVAGGLGHGYSVDATMVKESAEEADVPAALARSARPVGALSYVTEIDEIDGGLRDDTLFIFDLEVPEDFVPENTDGELSGFERWPIAAVEERVRDTGDFKFNVAPVIVEFLLRHGRLDPDRDADYLRIVRALHGGCPTGDQAAER